MTVVLGVKAGAGVNKISGQRLQSEVHCVSSIVELRFAEDL